MLKSFHHSELTEVNRRATMQPVRSQHLDLIRKLHCPVDLQHHEETEPIKPHSGWQTVEALDVHDVDFSTVPVTTAVLDRPRTSALPSMTSNGKATNTKNRTRATSSQAQISYVSGVWTRTLSRNVWHRRVSRPLCS